MTGAVSFRDKQVREVMTPGHQMFSVRVSDRLDYKTLAAIYRAGYSRIPVWNEAGTAIVGLLYAKDLMLCEPRMRTPVAAVLQFFGRTHVNAVDDEAPLGEVLQLFSATRQHFAIVRRRADTPVPIPSDSASRAPHFSPSPSSSALALAALSGSSASASGAPSAGAGSSNLPAASAFAPGLTPGPSASSSSSSSGLHYHVVGIITLEDVTENIMSASIEDEFDVFRPGGERRTMLNSAGTGLAATAATAAAGSGAIAAAATGRGGAASSTPTSHQGRGSPASSGSGSGSSSVDDTHGAAVVARTGAAAAAAAASAEHAYFLDNGFGMRPSEREARTAAAIRRFFALAHAAAANAARAAARKARQPGAAAGVPNLTSFSSSSSSSPPDFGASAFAASFADVGSGSPGGFSSDSGFGYSSPYRGLNNDLTMSEVMGIAAHLCANVSAFRGGSSGSSFNSLHIASSSAGAATAAGAVDDPYVGGGDSSRDEGASATSMGRLSIELVAQLVRLCAVVDLVALPRAPLPGILIPPYAPQPHPQASGAPLGVGAQVDPTTFGLDLAPAIAAGTLSQEDSAAGGLRQGRGQGGQSSQRRSASASSGTSFSAASGAAALPAGPAKQSASRSAVAAAETATPGPFSVSSAPGDAFMVRGRIATAAFVILEGEVEVWSGADGLRCVFGPWDVLGEGALLRPEGAYAPDFTARPLAPVVRALRIDKMAFDACRLAGTAALIGGATAGAAAGDEAQADEEHLQQSWAFAAPATSTLAVGRGSSSTARSAGASTTAAAGGDGLLVASTAAGEVDGAPSSVLARAIVPPHASPTTLFRSPLLAGPDAAAAVAPSPTARPVELVGLSAADGEAAPGSGRRPSLGPRAMAGAAAAAAAAAENLEDAETGWLHERATSVLPPSPFSARAESLFGPAPVKYGHHSARKGGTAAASATSGASAPPANTLENTLQLGGQPVRAAPTWTPETRREPALSFYRGPARSDADREDEYVGIAMGSSQN